MLLIDFLQLKCPSVESITESPTYKILLDHASKLEHTISEYGDELPRLKDELARLHSTRKEWEDNCIVRLFTVPLNSLIN